MFFTIWELHKLSGLSPNMIRNIIKSVVDSGGGVEKRDVLKSWERGGRYEYNIFDIIDVDNWDKFQYRTRSNIIRLRESLYDYIRRGGTPSELR